MASTLSFWRRVYRDVSLVGATIPLIWRANRFDRLPTEENLLISFWYDYAYYRCVLPERTVYNFIDSRVLVLEENVEGLRRRKRRKRRLQGYLLGGLRNKRIRLMVVDFLESPSAENYLPVLEAIWSAWRMPDGDRIEIGGEAGGPEEKGEDVEERLLNAKAYVIAVQLYFELERKEEEYESLSRRLPDLKNFIREKFGVERMPGRLEDFKGYSYIPILEGKHSSKKGQLRMPFRQIGEHPEIFGEAVAARARKIIEKHFKRR